MVLDDIGGNFVDEIQTTLTGEVEIGGKKIPKIAIIGGVIVVFGGILILTRRKGGTAARGSSIPKTGESAFPESSGDVGQQQAGQLVGDIQSDLLQQVGTSNAELEQRIGEQTQSLFSDLQSQIGAISGNLGTLPPIPDVPSYNPLPVDMGNLGSYFGLDQASMGLPNVSYANLPLTESIIGGGVGSGGTLLPKEENVGNLRNKASISSQNLLEGLKKFGGVQTKILPRPKEGGAIQQVARNAGSIGTTLVGLKNRGITTAKPTQIDTDAISRFREAMKNRFQSKPQIVYKTSNVGLGGRTRPSYDSPKIKSVGSFGSFVNRASPVSGNYNALTNRFRTAIPVKPVYVGGNTNANRFRGALNRNIR